MSEDWPSNPFWDFSLALYRRPGVAQACLTLQERLGIDVNVLLYVVWLGTQGHQLSTADAALIVKHVGAWHDGVVRPLRALRTDMKTDPKGAPPAAVERLRAQVKSAELNAERIEQDMLHALPRAGVEAKENRAMRRNTECYFEALQITAQPIDWEAADIVLANTKL